MDKDLFDGLKGFLESVPNTDALKKYSAPISKSASVAEITLPIVLIEKIIYDLICSYLADQSSFELACFQRWWNKQGDWQLSASEFQPIAAIAYAQAIGNYTNYSHDNNNPPLYKVPVNFYNSPEYKWALGMSNIYFWVTRKNVWITHKSSLV